MTERLPPAKPSRKQVRSEAPWWVYTAFFWPGLAVWPLILLGGRYQYSRGVERDAWVDVWAIPLAFVLMFLIPWAARRFVADRGGRAALVHGVTGFVFWFCLNAGADPHAPHRWRDHLLWSAVLGPALYLLSDGIVRWREARFKRQREEREREERRRGGRAPPPNEALHLPGMRGRASAALGRVVGAPPRAPEARK